MTDRLDDLWSAHPCSRFNWATATPDQVMDNIIEGMAFTMKPKRHLPLSPAVVLALMASTAVRAP